MGNREKALVGIDIGGSKIELICWRKGKIGFSKTVRTPKTKKRFLTVVFGLVGEASQTAKIVGIGLAVAGAQDLKKGMIIHSPNLKFLDGMRLRAIVSRKFQVRVLMDNDTNCFLLAEKHFGQARNRKDVILLTLGTGVGGAVIGDGKLLHGKHGSAGEFGHMIIAGNLGKFDSLEDLASSHAFQKLKNPDPLFWQHRAEQGDQKAKKIYEQLGKYLGAALSSLVNIFDPELIIIGGGISRGGKLFLPQALKEIKKYTMIPAPLLPLVKVSKLRKAGALGAVALFF